VRGDGGKTRGWPGEVHGRCLFMLNLDAMFSFQPFVQRQPLGGVRVSRGCGGGQGSKLFVFVVEGGWGHLPGQVSI